jgi:hypothetical protein
MARKSGLPGHPSLAEVEKRFRAWRDTRRRGEKIPQDLWRAAVNLAGRYTFDQIAFTLKVHRGRLEKRVKTAARAQDRPTALVSTPQQGFIEVGTLGGGYHEACTVESKDSDGRTLTMHLQGPGCRHVIDIAKAFWSVGR